MSLSFQERFKNRANFVGRQGQVDLVCSSAITKPNSNQVFAPPASSSYIPSSLNPAQKLKTDIPLSSPPPANLSYLPPNLHPTPKPKTDVLTQPEQNPVNDFEDDNITSDKNLTNPCGIDITPPENASNFIEHTSTVPDNTANCNSLGNQNERNAYHSSKAAPREKMKYMNIFLHPEQLNDNDIRNLIHINREQFFSFVDAIKPHLEKIQSGKTFRKLSKKCKTKTKNKSNTKSQRTTLSIFSIAFLFRLKLAKNKSFNELATLFVISKRTAILIYKKVLDIVYKYHVALPDILSGDAVEKLFDDLANSMDPFYRELFRPFKDPIGKP